jgi:1,4-alpha-glucan branching enzyme
LPGLGGYERQPHVQIEEVLSPGDTDPIKYWLQYAERAASQAAASVPRAAVVQCHDWTTILAGVATRRLLGCPLVFNVHLPQKTVPHSTMENLGLLAADLVIVNSASVLAEILERKLPVRRIEVVPNGVDINEYRPAEDWPRHEGYLLFAGRYVPQKGVEALLRAFSILLYRLDCRLVLAGEGILELYFLRLARILGIADRVSFRSWQTGDALVRLYQKAALICVPSSYEPFGIVALEAMACARPVIASRTGGLMEIVEDGVDGYLVEPGDYLDLARRMLKLLTDCDLASRMGANARAKALRYSWDRAAERTSALYRETAWRDDGWIASPQAARTMTEMLDQVELPFREIIHNIVGRRGTL